MLSGNICRLHKDWLIVKQEEDELFLENVLKHLIKMCFNTAKYKIIQLGTKKADWETILENSMS